MELIGKVMLYDWGKIGLQSVVAQLAYLNDSEFCLDPDGPYAELWMGDHVDGQAMVKASGLDLGEVLDRKLSFHLKAVSLKNALSIQIHPNQEEAAKLYLERPTIYKDFNHRPKIIIALTPFLLLCGFRTCKEILKICTQIRPLKKIIGEKILETLKENSPESTKTVFREVMYTPKRLLKVCLQQIDKEYRPEMKKYQVFEIFKRLYCKFPEDVGVLAVFFLNPINLITGQSAFIEPNKIHAYLNGDGLECAAVSDNVIRGGLTSELRDLKQFMSLVDYKGDTIDANIFQPIYYDMYRTIYAPPVNEFAVVRLKLPIDAGEYSIEYHPTDSILVVVHGAGYMRFPMQCIKIPIKRGNIYYIPPCAAPELTFEPVECETCEDVPLNYDMDAEIGVFSIEIHTNSSDVQTKSNSASYLSRTSSYENKPYFSSSSCDVDIEKCSSNFINEVCEEEEEPATSSTEDVPLSKRKYQDFEIFIASPNVFLDMGIYPGFCCPPMKQEEESDW